jgi:hypothetical protein
MVTEKLRMCKFQTVKCYPSQTLFYWESFLSEILIFIISKFPFTFYEKTNVCIYKHQLTPCLSNFPPPGPPKVGAVNCICTLLIRIFWWSMGMGTWYSIQSQSSKVLQCSLFMKQKLRCGMVGQFKVHEFHLLSKKATKNDEIFTFDLRLTSYCQFLWPS